MIIIDGSSNTSASPEKPGHAQRVKGTDAVSQTPLEFHRGAKSLYMSMVLEWDTQHARLGVTVM